MNDSRDVSRAKLVEIVKEEVGSGSDHKSNKTGNVAEQEETVEQECANSDDEMSSEAKILFRLESDDWESFCERLELFFKVKKITAAEMKRAHLLTHCDEATYKLFKNLCAPTKPAEKEYAGLVKLLSEHLKPTPSEVMERCSFNRAKQETNETVADFATRLDRLALDCNFTELLGALRDQFVCGISDKSIQVDIFTLSNLTFDKALKEATARESAINNAATAIKNLSSTSYKLENFSIEGVGALRPR